MPPGLCQHPVPTIVSPIYYEMKPTNGEACPSGWMNVGAGYCRKK